VRFARRLARHFTSTDLDVHLYKMPGEQGLSMRFTLSDRSRLRINPSYPLVQKVDGVVTAYNLISTPDDCLSYTTEGVLAAYSTSPWTSLEHLIGCIPVPNRSKVRALLTSAIGLLDDGGREIDFRGSFRVPGITTTNVQAMIDGFTAPAV